MTDKLLTFLLVAPALAAAHMNRCPTVEESDAFERSLSEQQVFAARSLAPAAVESTYLYQTKHFVVAYQRAGVHAVAGAITDADKDGVPDNIQKIGEIAERVWRLGMDTLKYKAPPGRDSITGYKVRTKTGKFPIVVGDMATFSTNWAGKQFMGYALRPLVDPDSLGGGQLVIDNDFLDGGVPILAKVGPENSANGVDSILYDYSKDPVKGWSTTIAHEFYHSLQYQYDQYYRYAWHEMTATWFAKRAYPEVKHHWQYLGAFIKNNSAGPFETWDAMAPYYNFAFVSMAADIFGEAFLLPLWSEHYDNFEIDEDYWFGKAIRRNGFSEKNLLRGYAAEFLRLTENVPGILNDGGKWANSRATMTTTAFVKSKLISVPGFIMGGSQVFGNMYCYLNRDQFKSGNIMISADTKGSEAGAGIIRLPSGIIESFTASSDTVVIGPMHSDTAWRVVLITGFWNSADGGAIPHLETTRKSPAGINLQKKQVYSLRDVLRFDLRGRPVTSATRGIILEGSPETGWHRRIKLLEE